MQVSLRTLLEETSKIQQVNNNIYIWMMIWPQIECYEINVNESIRSMYKYLHH